MKNLMLERFLANDAGVFGTLEFALEHAPVLYTGEDEWRDNAHSISCIPEGVYRIHRRFSPHFNREMYEVTGVPNRGGILIHAGTTEENTEGCILLGMKLGIASVKKDEETGLPRKKTAVLQSRDALKLFEDEMAGGDGMLTVAWAKVLGPR